jgi:hypothetical protein
MNKFNYPKLERVDTEIGRHYRDSNNNLVPSVTTVLSGTSDNKDGIEKWRKKVGDIEADRIMKQSTDIGTAVHEAIEKFWVIMIGIIFKTLVIRSWLEK